MSEHLSEFVFVRCFVYNSMRNRWRRNVWFAGGTGEKLFDLEPSTDPMLYISACQIERK